MTRSFGVNVITSPSIGVRAQSDHIQLALRHVGGTLERQIQVDRRARRRRSIGFNPSPDIVTASWIASAMSVAAVIPVISTGDWWGCSIRCPYRIRTSVRVPLLIRKVSPSTMPPIPLPACGTCNANVRGNCCSPLPIVIAVATGSATDHDAVDQGIIVIV